MTNWSLAISAIVAGCALAIARADTVERRSGEAAVQGRVTRIDDAGVTVSAENGDSMTVSWDRVRDVQMPVPDKSLPEYLARATELWRGRIRVERGDCAMAEPILASAFFRYKGQSGETALVVAEGLLRCRIAQQEHDQALIPALEVVRLRRAGVATISYSRLSKALDDRTFLCTSLAPFWVKSAALARLESDLAAYEPNDPAVAAMAWQYRRMLRHELGMLPLTGPAPASDDAGTLLLRELAEALCGGDAERIAVRDRIVKSLSASSGWTEAWMRFGLGCSLFAESEVGRHQSGLVQLAYLPARFAIDQPYLSGLAIARISAAMDDYGDHEAATALRAELQKSYATHPILAVMPRTPAASQVSE